MKTPTKSWLSVPLMNLLLLKMISRFSTFGMMTEYSVEPHLSHTKEAPIESGEPCLTNEYTAIVALRKTKTSHNATWVPLKWKESNKKPCRAQQSTRVQSMPSQCKSVAINQGVDKVNKVPWWPSSLPNGPCQSVSSYSFNTQDSIYHSEGVLCRPWSRLRRKG